MVPGSSSTLSASVSVGTHGDAEGGGLPEAVAGPIPFNSINFSTAPLLSASSQLLHFCSLSLASCRHFLTFSGSLEATNFGKVGLNLPLASFQSNTSTSASFSITFASTSGEEKRAPRDESSWDSRRGEDLEWAPLSWSAEGYRRSAAISTAREGREGAGTGVAEGFWALLRGGILARDGASDSRHRADVKC